MVILNNQLLWFIFYRDMPQIDHSCIVNKVVKLYSVCHMVKTDLKTLESNGNWKNYLGELPLITVIDLLSCPRWEEGETFFSISRWEQAIESRGTFLSRPQISREKNEFNISSAPE
jgi:hypothetical protein